MHISGEQKFLKKPGNLLKTLGPSLLFAALALNGGEMLLWPNLVTNYSLALLIFIPIILTLQWAVNVEISRLTAFNGENILHKIGGGRNGILKYFLLSILVLTLVWPAWVSIAGGTIGTILGLESRYFNLASIFCLLVMIPAFKNPNYYKLFEKIAKFGLIFILSLISIVLVILHFKQGLRFPVENEFFVKDKDFALLYAAVAYGGLAGVLNFTQADWIKSKGYANAGGKQISWENRQNQNIFKSWMSFLAKENGLVFWLGNLIGIFLIAIVSVNILPKTPTTGFGLIQLQLNALSDIYPILKYLWAGAVVTLFLMAQLTILDAAGRLWYILTQKDKESIVNINEEISLKTEKNIQKNRVFTFASPGLKNFKEKMGEAAKNEVQSEIKSRQNLLEKQQKSRYSLNFLYIGITIFALAFFSDKIKQPSTLLQISASFAAFSFSFLPLLVLYYNHKNLLYFARPAWWQTLLVLFCAAFYLTLTIIFVLKFDQVF